MCSVAETARPDNPDATDVSYQWKTTIADVPVDAPIALALALPHGLATPGSRAWWPAADAHRGLERLA